MNTLELIGVNAKDTAKHTNERVVEVCTSGLKNCNRKVWVLRQACRKSQTSGLEIREKPISGVWL